MPRPAFTLPSGRSSGWLEFAAVVLAFWTFFGILSSAHFFLAGEAGGSGGTLRDFAGHIVPFYWAWAIVTPEVLLLCRAVLRSARSGWQRALLAAAALPLIVASHGVLYLAGVRLLGVEPALHIDLAALIAFFARHGASDLMTVVLLGAAYAFFDTSRRAREREIEASALQREVALLNLEMLRWQLQPHFLFNALNTVSTLVLKGDVAAADEAIALIGRYLRAALEHQAERQVPLATELEMVQRYVEIERLRFGAGLHLDLAISAEALAGQVPALILQPLVENAVRHGLGDGSDADAIAVAAVVCEGRLRLCVRDPARGAAVDARANDDGFGLRYVRQRLVHFHGDRAWLRIRSEADGTEASVELPYLPATP
jgi:hypothetical protein